MRSRYSLVSLLLFALALFTPPRAHAAAEGNYHWITPVAGYGTFSNILFYPGNWPLDDAPVFGARLGTQLNPWWGIEAAGAYSKSGEDRPIDTDVESTVMKRLSSRSFFSAGSVRRAVSSSFVPAGSSASRTN